MHDIDKPVPTSFRFPKSQTGILGLDDLTNGGLPENRPTLLLGNTGCGKTIMAMEFLVNGIVMFDEPGVFMAFEEKTEEITLNVKSLGYDLDRHVADNTICLEHVQINADEITTTGKYDLEGLFVRIQLAIDKVKAKRIVLDSLDTLFYGFDHFILRSEFRRLFSWLKDRNVTAIITGEVGDIFLTRHGLEEYVADCVIVLDNRVADQLSTRRLRIVKYRGSVHGNNEYPFIIDEKGITVLPEFSTPLNYQISSEIIGTGIKDLDEMLGHKGYYVGSSILISGTAGTGKTSIAATFASSVCKQKMKCIYCAFEESPNQVIRNMSSIGLSLDPLIAAGNLHFYYSRPNLQNLELHFISIRKMINEIKPSVLIFDPVTNFMTESPNSGVRLMLTRFVDYLKTQQITVIFTAAITEKLIEHNPSDEGISSMVDTWIMVQDSESEAERKPTCTILKARGMSHSKKVKEFVLSSKGITLNSLTKSDARHRDSTK